QYFDVKIEYVDITKDEFNAKMKSFSDNLENMFSESKELEDDIKSSWQGWFMSKTISLKKVAITSPINNLNYGIILNGKNRCKKIITQRVV
ncbi:MAG: hypothetical protein LRY22_03410, partial [Aliarcobacter cryaerophilus]|nr:hypothetical protein [Aliarcobacter cryaerophilus]